MSDLGVEAEKSKNFVFLDKLYEMARGKMSYEADVSELSKELELNIMQIQEIGLALMKEGLVTVSAGEYIRLTSKGIEEIERVHGPMEHRSWWKRLFGK